MEAIKNREIKEVKEELNKSKEKIILDIITI